MLTVVIPTITGREAMLEQTVGSFRVTVPSEHLQLIIVKDRPTIGEAWNDGAEMAEGRYIMLAADDVLMHPGWYPEACYAADVAVYPAPRIMTTSGETFATGSMGGGWILTTCGDRAPVASSQFPFFTAYAWRELGPCLDIHYFADDFLAARARSLGMAVEYRKRYALTHLEGTVGRSTVVRRSVADRAAFETAMSSDLWREI